MVLKPRVKPAFFSLAQQCWLPLHLVCFSGYKWDVSSSVEGDQDKQAQANKDRKTTASGKLIEEIRKSVWGKARYFPSVVRWLINALTWVTNVNTSIQHVHFSVLYERRKGNPVSDSFSDCSNYSQQRSMSVCINQLDSVRAFVCLFDIELIPLRPRSIDRDPK